MKLEGKRDYSEIDSGVLDHLKAQSKLKIMLLDEYL